MALSTAFWESQVLLTANRIGVFERLADGPADLETLCGRLATAPRPTRLLLNACVGLGLLTEDAGCYANSALAAGFLVSGQPGYLGNAIRYSDNLYQTWGRLEQALRNDEPQLGSATYLGEDTAVTRDFVYGMHDRALGIGRVLVELVPFEGVRQMLDVAGGPGTYAALFAQRHPELRAVVLDLPGIVAHAREIIATMGVAERVTTLAGSFQDTVFPGSNDLVLISGLLHRETPESCRRLIGRAADALLPGGRLIVSDVFTDAGGISPPFAALFGINMMLTAPDGGVHADADVAAWMRQAGMTAITVQPFPPPMPHRVVSGVKN
ncbi:MAG: methyltransferase [Pseudomonadales bacterium]